MTRLTAREIMSNNFEISLVVFVPNKLQIMLLPILICHFHDEGTGQQLSVFFVFLPSHLNLLNQYATSSFPMMHLIPPQKNGIVQALPSVDSFVQLFKRSPASVNYNRVLSHFQFAERF